MTLQDSDVGFLGFAVGKLLLQHGCGRFVAGANHHTTRVAVETVNNAWAVGVKVVTTITTEEFCYGKLIVERAFGVAQYADWFVNNNHIVVDVDNR